jgi:hypothetical protein
MFLASHRIERVLDFCRLGLAGPDSQHPILGLALAPLVLRRNPRLHRWPGQDWQS